MTDDLRHRYAEAIRNHAGLGLTVEGALDAVMAVRDEELEQLRYERRLLGAARMVLDLVAAGDSSQWDQARREAEDLAQRIVDEIGHPVTDEPALGPVWRQRAEAAEAKLAEVEDAITWGVSCTRHAELLTECRRQEERAEQADAAIARVRALHKPFHRGDKVQYCDHCSVSAGTPWRRYVLVPWPCDTLAVLDDTGVYARKDEPMQVITTDASDRYHASEDCPAWKAGRQGSEAHGYTLHEIRRLTVADAEAAKKKPCPTCVTP